MKQRMLCNTTHLSRLLMLLPLMLLNQTQASAEMLVKPTTFKTEDDWTIHATYYVSDNPGSDPIPGVVLLSEPDWVPRSILDYISETIVAGGMAALTIDVRGTDASIGRKEYQKFLPEERDDIQLDIRAAIQHLASQKEIDPYRIAVFGAGSTADYVVREGAKNPDNVKALILTTGWLSDEGRMRIKSRKDLPLLVVASEDTPKQAQALASEAYYLSEHENSKLMFVMDRGASFFNRPGEPDKKVVSWLQDNLQALGLQTDISFKTADGATLQGTLYKPHGATQNEKVAGVVFVHGANHDASTWYHLAEEVTKSGVAALIFDQRGFRTSMRGNQDSRDFNIPADVEAAVNYLASQDWVDSNRLAITTATSRGGPVVVAAHKDPRVKTIVGLSFYGTDYEPNIRDHISNMDIPFFLVVSTTDIRGDGRSLADSTQEVYELSNNKDTEIILYDDAGRGSSMLKTKPELTGMIVRWFNKKLSN